MSIRILTKNNVDNTNIDGARDSNFNAGRRSGIVKGALNQGNFFSSSSNTIALDTCELRLCGHRVVIDSIEYKTLVNVPSVPIRYSLVASIVIDVNFNVAFELLLQTSSTSLTQDNLDQTGSGTYQLEIGRFTQQTDGTITDIVRTADLITGGIGDLDGGAINIGNVTTNTLEAGMEAEVDVEERFEPKDKKTYTDFTFSIPKGDQGVQGEKGDQGIQGVRGEKGDKGDKGDTGATPNITATATTLPAGSSATVTKSGTAENPAFAFGIPKGDKGEKGEKGDKGESGLIYQTTGQNTDGAMSQKATTDELNKKVDKVNGKGLSTNDFTNDYKTKVDNNTTARHSHINKTILDNTTASYTMAEKTKLSSLAQEVNLNITSVFLEANDTPTTIYTSSTSLVGRKFKIEFYYDTGAKSARSALKSVEFKVDTAISPAREMACDCGMYNTSTPECIIIGLALKYTNTTIIVSNRTTKIGNGTLVNPRKDYSHIYIKALYEIK